MFSITLKDNSKVALKRCLCCNIVARTSLTTTCEEIKHLDNHIKRWAGIHVTRYLQQLGLKKNMNNLFKVPLLTGSVKRSLVKIYSLETVCEINFTT